MSGKSGKSGKSGAKENAQKRFIAGAVCPQCQALDRLVLEEDAQVEPPLLKRRCVSCGFVEVLDQAPSYSLPSSIKDRPSKPSGPGQVVRILDP